MSAQVDVLAVLDRQLRDRAERANRYRKNAEKSARKSGEPQITADRMAAYTDLQLVELREARAAVSALIAERDALREVLHEGRRAIGDHYAPNDCYATGPMTGNEFRDLVQCPACSFIAMYGVALARAQGEDA